MKNTVLFISVLVLIFAGCATTGLIQEIPIDKVYTSSIQLKNKTLPLPEGQWKVIGRGLTKGGGKYFTIIMIKESENKQIHSAISISVDSHLNSYSGYQPSKYCKRVDVHYSDVKSNKSSGRQDCWLINHVRMQITPKQGIAFKEAYNYLATNKFIIPKIVIESFHHFTGKYANRKYLDYRYYINPEAEGFKAPTDTNWSTSEWHPLQINKDPKKVAFIEKIKTEGKVLHAKISEGFGK